MVPPVLENGCAFIMPTFSKYNASEEEATVSFLETVASRNINY